MQGQGQLIARGPSLRNDAGRAPKSKGGKPRSRPKRRPSAAPAAKKRDARPKTHACPECGRAFRTDEAVQTHRHAAHGTAALAVGDMTRCPECGSLVKNSVMAKHRRREHGIL